MAKLTVEELYRGEKYDIMGKAFKDLYETYKPGKDAFQIWELAIVRHTLIAAEKMKQEGDTVSDLNDTLSPPSI